MKRVSITPRADWRAKVEALGFDFHTIVTDEDPTGVYWDESAYWQLSAAEVDVIDDASVELHKMCMAAAKRIVTERLYPLLGIAPEVAKVIEESWKAHGEGADFALYGRFDLAYGGAEYGDGMPKLLEYNADTPTGLFEAAVIQWQWLEDLFPDGDQFNSIHEALVDRWRGMIRLDRSLAASPERRASGELGGNVHFTCDMPSPEDEGTLRYLMDTAVEAGLAGKIIAVADIGWSEEDEVFVDLEDEDIGALFKLSPWEWLVQDEFGADMLKLVQERRLMVIEPVWKMLLSNKGLLAVLWEMYPHHPYLIEAHFDRKAFPAGTKVVAKPLLGREGANVSVATLGEGGQIVGTPLLEVDGPYGSEGYVYQAWSPVVSAVGPDPRGRSTTHHAVIGSWMIGEKCHGIGIREDSSEITKNTSRFVPHRFE